MKRLAATAILGWVAFAAPPALAQSNPFMPPQGGMSKSQIQEIVRAEVERQRSGQPSRPGAPATGQPGQPANGQSPGPGVQSQMRDGRAVDGIPTQQGGTPRAGTAATPGGTPAATAADAVGELLKEGGVFVGCVSGTPVFKDGSGRRAYFTTRELRESNAARRYTRCN